MYILLVTRDTEQQNRQESLVWSLPVPGVGARLLCKHRLPLTKSGLIHRETNRLCQMLMEAFLWVEK